MRLLSAALFLALLTPGTASADRCANVSTDAELATAIARPNACVRVADGTYAAPTITASGVVLKARRPLGAGFTSGTVVVTGAGVTVDGFTFTGSANFRFADSVGSRVTRSLFRSSAANFVEVIGRYGDSNRIDHNELGPKAQLGHMVQIGKNPYTPTRTRVDHNYLHDLASGVQGGEALRVGGFGPPGDYFPSYSVFEHNLLVRLDGDAEILSLKGSANTFRYNTVRASVGSINIRAGDRNAIHGNFILGDGVPGTQGIRLSEDNHRIYNNYVDVSELPLVLHAGDPKPGDPPPGVPPSGPFTGHAQVRNAVVVHNTLLGATSGVDFGGGTKPPDNLSFVDNLVRSGGVNVGNGSTPTASTFAGNIVFGGEPGVSGPGFRNVDPRLVRVHGLLQPGLRSPALKSGAPTFVEDDVRGGRRISPPDVGAIEVFSWPVRYPLTPDDVR